MNNGLLKYEIPTHFKLEIICKVIIALFCNPL